jgi:hypothetical protein
MIKYIKLVIDKLQQLLTALELRKYKIKVPVDPLCDEGLPLIDGAFSLILTQWKWQTGLL